MIVNRKNNINTNHVEFVSYDGAYPNLCRGILIVKIDGELVKFGHDYSNCHYDSETKTWSYTDEDPDNPNYGSFWSSGGSITHDGYWNDIVVHHNEWEIDIDELDPKFWDVADELDKLINENIPYGCCGGCV